jgi:choline dehydrogenase-like flavoprotein
LGQNIIYDYIVVGTGPGGAAVALELATQKKSMIIIEHGSRLVATGFKNINKLYDERHSLEGIPISRARVLGGSSFVAMGNAVTPPSSIIKEWGFDLNKELESARRDLKVNPMPVDLMGPGTRRINEGAASIGYDMKQTPKSVDFSKCTACSMCMFGCPQGAKWTSLDYIDEAVANGADLMLDTEVVEVTQSNGEATGIIGYRKGSRIEVKAQKVVVAAGALETPRILQNSGIREAGKGLSIDAFQATYGYTDDAGMKNEIILATYLEGLLEEKEFFTAPYMYVPFLIALNLKDNGTYQRSLLNIARTYIKGMSIDTGKLLGLMTKIRDESTGIVMSDGKIHKALTETDKEKLEDAHEINKEILIASGVDSGSIFRTRYESGHPACTAAIGKVVDCNQETEINGLFVSDASVFPSPLGVPPILTIVALSKRLARHLINNY